MAPSAAVEIDPRLLRQLEEEYETLKNDSSGARGLVSPTPASARLLIPISDDTSLTSRWNHDVRPDPHPAGPPTDFSKWIKRRLRQAKSAGLIRVAKPTAARTLASAPAMSRPAKAYSPAAYDAEASSSAATTEATPARAPAQTPKPAPEPAPSPKPTAPAVQTPAARPDAPPDADAESPAPRAFSPVVFQPRGVPVARPRRRPRRRTPRRRPTRAPPLRTPRGPFRPHGRLGALVRRGRLGRRRRRRDSPARRRVGPHGANGRRRGRTRAAHGRGDRPRAARHGAPIGGDGRASRGPRRRHRLSRIRHPRRASGGARRSRREIPRGGRASATRDRVGDEEQGTGGVAQRARRAHARAGTRGARG